MKLVSDIEQQTLRNLAQRPSIVFSKQMVDLVHKKAKDIEPTLKNQHLIPIHFVIRFYF